MPEVHHGGTSQQGEWQQRWEYLTYSCERRTQRRVGDGDGDDRRRTDGGVSYYDVPTAPTLGGKACNNRLTYM
jgi:hypothetical protein